MRTKRRAVSATASDAELMDRVLEDDAAAFALLYDRYAARAFRVARIVCHRPGAAEEAMEEAFLAIWRSRPTDRDDGEDFATWALRIVRDHAVDVTRRDAARDPIASEQARRLRGVLAGLPDEQSEVITLALYGKLSHTEIAAELGLPEDTVKGRMRLGLQELNRTIA